MTKLDSYEGVYLVTDYDSEDDTLRFEGISEVVYIPNGSVWDTPPFETGQQLSVVIGRDLEGDLVLTSAMFLPISVEAGNGPTTGD